MDVKWFPHRPFRYGWIDGWCGNGRVGWNMDHVVVPEVPTMEVLDQIRCVICGKSEYQYSKGKSSRTFMGVCKDHEKEVLGETQETIPGAEPKVVPARKPGER